MGLVLPFQKRFTSDDKMRELILYLLDKMGPLTWEQICWMLWKIDSEAFLRTGESITGSRYYKAPNTDFI